MAQRDGKQVNDATLDVTGDPPFVNATGGTVQLLQEIIKFTLLQTWNFRSMFSSNF